MKQWMARLTLVGSAALLTVSLLNHQAPLAPVAPSAARAAASPRVTTDSPPRSAPALVLPASRNLAPTPR